MINSCIVTHEAYVGYLNVFSIKIYIILSIHLLPSKSHCTLLRKVVLEFFKNICFSSDIFMLFFKNYNYYFYFKCKFIDFYN